jgi:NAD(P)-dependent dehydrogenase (short-subunit alcohol dehydrogenase family)
MRGAHVIAAATSKGKAEAALASVSAKGTPIACDLSEPSSVRKCVDEVVAQGKRLDAIVCNAGIMALPKLSQKHGLELQFLTNHVGHFLLVMGLVDRLAERGRVVVVSSDAHRRAPSEGIQFDNLSGERDYDPWKAYGQSKLANLLFAKKLAKKLEATGRTANALHPGVIHTNLVRHMNPLTNVALMVAGPIALKTIPQGAATQCYLAAHPDAASFSGAYFADCNVAEPSRKAKDPQLADRLWGTTEEIAAKIA